jgi:hypothetical protein
MMVSAVMRARLRLPRPGRPGSGLAPGYPGVDPSNNSGRSPPVSCHLPQSHPRPFAVLLDEDHAGRFEPLANQIEAAGEG